MKVEDKSLKEFREKLLKEKGISMLLEDEIELCGKPKIHNQKYDKKNFISHMRKVLRKNTNSLKEIGE